MLPLRNTVTFVNNRIINFNLRLVSPTGIPNFDFWRTARSASEIRRGDQRTQHRPGKEAAMGCWHCPCGSLGVDYAGSSLSFSRRKLSFWFPCPSVHPSGSTVRPRARLVRPLRCHSGNSGVAAADGMPALGSVSAPAPPFSASATVGTPSPSSSPIHPFLVSTGIESGETSFLSPVTISIPFGERQVLSLLPSLLSSSCCVVSEC